MVYFIGDIIDSVGPNTLAKDMLDDLEYLSLIVFIVGIGMFFTVYAFYTLLLVFSENISYKTRIAYLKAILN